MSSCGICQILSGKLEFQWKAIGWSLSHFGFQFHGNSDFFPRNSNGNGRNPRASGNNSHGNPWNSIGIPLKFCRNPMGMTIIYIVKNSYNSKNRILGSRNIMCTERATFLQLHHKTIRSHATDLGKSCFWMAMAKLSIGVC